MPKKKAPAKRAKKLPASPLLYADTRMSADQLYIGGFSVPDAFISFKKGRKWYAVLNQLEYARALKESRFDEVLQLELWLEVTREKFKRAKVGYAELVSTLAAEFEIESFKVPGDFPSSLAFQLVELGVKVDVCEGSLFPSRETKSEEELAWIREGNRCSAIGIRAAEKAIRQSLVKKGKLVLGGKTLTSERLRSIIEIACLEAGSLSMDTIAAGGDQACDPHCAGQGPLRANELIIVDVFPRVSRTGYHGDMTRTFLKGKANEAQKGIVDAVFKAQQDAIQKVKTGVNGKTVHGSVLETFAKLGYETRCGESGAEGFIHGTGHGLGLEVHEAPRVSVVSNKLKRNAVVTVEPGLYYPGVGGCRIEDVVAVRDDGPEFLSEYHYRWQIK
ncbi:Xaa-Pro peptidase family protein [Pelagicoccus sp. SDUM812002]|uniref:M24 family metallopeptidase n=1 Tax=Pelagicoccus sp. SDUM812002 TaxID=3041266 RepID=UPI00281072D3|nr:Xaa-Pro peptidase family protein [Pelagicoccus sp. SDUM812002]MDQ8187838.1 Xaa-Pro peptidase family protein [Pelagicoccus sp. SDUM812002]